MGFIYRPKLKGTGRPLPEGTKRCPDKLHGKRDECPTCGARFSSIWWAKYYADGIAVRESTDTDSETEARRYLKIHEGKAASGHHAAPHLGRILYGEVAADLRTYYLTYGKRDLGEVEDRLTHLDKFFSGMRIATIWTLQITAFVTKRKGEGAANATINRDLSVLRRMLRLAQKNKKLAQVPPFEMLEENKPREGFFEREPFEAVKRHLAPDHQVIVTIEYAFGWRAKKETPTLKRTQVDLEVGTLRLEPGTTKNKDGRLVYMSPELLEMVRTQEERVRALERELGRPIPWLFPHLTGPHKGERLQSFRKAWITACIEATLDLEELEGEARERRYLEMREAIARGEKPGLVRMFRHDFRRTAVRNMVNNGVPERVAMQACGHETRSVFDTYHIVSPADLQEVARKQAGTFSGVLPPLESRPDSRAGARQGPPTRSRGARHTKSGTARAATRQGNNGIKDTGAERKVAAKHKLTSVPGHKSPEPDASSSVPPQGE
jgi:integrase